MTAISKTNDLEVVSGRRVDVIVWSFLGLIFIGVYIYAFSGWIFGPDFRPVNSGPDIPPLWMMILAHLIEVITVVSFALTFYFYVWRPWRRDGEISADGLAVLALITLYGQNTSANYFAVEALLNSAFINFGSWYGYIPGWQSHGMTGLPEAPIAWGLCFACWFVFFPMKIGAKLMSWTHSRYPRLSPVGVFLIAYIVFMALDFFLEGGFLFTGMYAYAGAAQKWSLWGGKTYQFPIYEIAGWGLAWTVWAHVYYTRDEHGLTYAERGVDALRVSSGMKKTFRFLALVGVFNVIFLVISNVPDMIGSLNADKFPKGYPSYLMNGICGDKIGYPCPGSTGTESPK